LVAALAALLLAHAAPGLGAGQGDGDERRRISALVEAATVMVLVVDRDGDVASSGSGFVVARGYAVTNAHVVAGAPGGSIVVLNESLPPTQARVVDSVLDEAGGREAGGRDLALLWFQAPGGQEPPALAFNLDVRKMDRVGSWGYPGAVMELASGGHGSAPVVYTEGTVSAFVESRLGRSIIHTAAISGGNSGGPLVNSSGEVVGMNTWTYAAAAGGAMLNMAQASDEIVGFLAKNGLEPRLAEGQVFVARERPRPAARAGGGKGTDGGLRDVGSFTLRVPAGWRVDLEERDYIQLSSAGDASTVIMGVIETEGLPAGTVAEILARTIGVDDPVPGEEKDGTFVFTGTRRGVDCVLSVAGYDDEARAAVIFVAGDLSDPGIGELADSVVDK
jgi:hypothetical protein